MTGSDPQLVQLPQLRRSQWQYLLNQTCRTQGWGRPTASNCPISHRSKSKLNANAALYMMQCSRINQIQPIYISRLACPIHITKHPTLTNPPRNLKKKKVGQWNDRTEAQAGPTCGCSGETGMPGVELCCCHWFIEWPWKCLCALVTICSTT